MGLLFSLIKMKIVQKKEDKSLDFYIVPNKKYNNLTEKKLLQEMENRLGKIDIKL